ncbi:hypothetical protein F8B43_1781 [Methylorubrum populi]|uniref:Uncharacterized protein n=1 Tax=Methylorubrum populi TaxID=223967 RepID=A0A833J811_9HYPH|nr:hypothetical protein F8B43_1781 [Methylorubrum populi]
MLFRSRAGGNTTTRLSDSFFRADQTDSQKQACKNAEVGIPAKYNLRVPTYGI